jgi:phage tail-like protein
MFFILEVAGSPQADFSDCAISSEVRVIDGDTDSHAPVLSGQHLRPTVTLTRRVNDNLALSTWHGLAIDNPAGARKDCAVLAFDTEGRMVARYNLRQAWPIKMEVGPLAESGAGLLVERVTLLCDDARRVTI